MFEFEKRKIPIGILGATGLLGRSLIRLLISHSVFNIQDLAASENSKGKTLKEVLVDFIDLPNTLRNRTLKSCYDDFSDCKLLFSCLPSEISEEIESYHISRGHVVISNASYARQRLSVPIIIPEINSDHISLISSTNSLIINANCSSTGLSLVLKPLFDNWGIENVSITTLQSLSGAGYSSLSAMNMTDNILPFIEKEEKKIETEPLKILGIVSNNIIKPESFVISASCFRVPITLGHTASVSVKLKKKADFYDIIDSWNTFTGKIKLPSSPKKILCYFEEELFPQPKGIVSLNSGMTVGIGRLRKCFLNDWKFVFTMNNLIRGGVGNSLLNAELFYERFLNKKTFNVCR